jgi:RNA polymerase sigma factor (sigma-70 family)
MRQIGVLASPTTSDHALLLRFVGDRSEAAFAALVERHAGMVLGVARRLLGDEHRAEDVCQATFLVLARRADVIQRQTSLAAWLHGVAMRLSFKARAQDARAARPDIRQRRCAGNPAEELTWAELRSVLDEELERLSPQYRLPLVLCYLEGCTRDEAAARLGWGVQRVKGLLERGRERLRRRLIQRGIVVPAALASSLLFDGNSSALPPLLATRILGTSFPFAAGVGLSECGVAGATSVLTQIGLQSMKTRPIRAITVFLAAFAFVGTGLWAFPAADDAKPPAEKPGELAKPATSPQWTEFKTVEARELTAGELRFTPDGKKLIRAPNATRIWICDTTDWVGKLVKRNAYDVGITTDGVPLAMNLEKNADKLGPAKLTLLEWESGKVRSQFEIDWFSPGVEARISPDGKTMIVQNQKGIFSIDAANGKQLAALPNHPRSFVMTFSPDSKFVAIQDLNTTRPVSNRVELYNARTLESAWLRKPQISRELGYAHITFSPDGKSIAVAAGTFPPESAPTPRGSRSEDTYKPLYLFDTETGKERSQLKRNEGHGAFNALAFFPDSKTVVADWHEMERQGGGPRQAGVILYEVNTGREIAVLKVGKPHPTKFESANSIAVSPDGRFIAAGFSDGTIKVWRYE